MIPQWGGHWRSRDKCNTLSLHLQKTHERQTIKKAIWPCDHVTNMRSRDNLKNVFSSIKRLISKPRRVLLYFVTYFLLTLWLGLQKNPLADALQNRFSWGFCQRKTITQENACVHRKRSLLESLFLPKTCNLRDSGAGFCLRVLRKFENKVFVEHLWWLLLEVTV